MRTLPLLALGFVALTCACGPTEAPPMTQADRAAIADTILELNRQLWAMADPLTPESFERQMELWVTDPAEYYVGDPAVWVSNLSVLATPADIRSAWEPSLETRAATTAALTQDNVAVISRDAALEFTKGTYTVTNKEGVTTEPSPFTTTTLWVRTPEGWRILHHHQSWRQQATAASGG